MSTRVRRIGVGSLGAVSAAIVASATAWACSAAATIEPCTNAKTEGLAGTRTAICGNALESGAQVFWGSAGSTPLAEVTGTSFGVTVQVPADAAQGLGRFVVRYAYSGGAVVKEKSIPFLVTGTNESVAPEAQLVAEPAASASGAEPAVATSPVPGATPAGVAAPGDSAAAVGPVEFVAGGASSPSAANSSASAPGVKTAAGRAVFGGSVAPEGISSQAAVASGDAAVVPEGLRGISPRTGTGDLWSGFQAGATENRALGLQTSAGQGTSSSGTAATVILLAGLVALAAGFGTAELSRRRALAHA